VSWGKVNPGVLPDTAVCYADSTIAFPLFAEYAVGSRWNRRERRELIHKRSDFVAALKHEATAARHRPRTAEGDPATMPDLERHR
jgi:hypothetical protein